MAIAEMEFKEDDSQLDIQHKLRMLEVYNTRLDEVCFFICGCVCVFCGCKCVFLWLQVRGQGGIAQAADAGSIQHAPG